MEIIVSILSHFRHLVLVALTATCIPAMATLVAYNSQSAFNAATAVKGVDNFNNLPALAPISSPMSRAAGPYSYLGTASTQGLFSAGTGPDIWLSTDQFTDSITFSDFGSGVSAIGGLFFGTDISGGLFSGQSIFLEATDMDGSLSKTLLNTSTDSFFGFVSDRTLKSLRVSAVQSIAGDVLSRYS